MTLTKKKLKPFTVDLPTRCVLVSPKKDAKGEEDDEGNVWRIDFAFKMRDGNDAASMMRFATKSARDRAFGKLCECTVAEQQEFTEYVTRKAVEMEEWVNKTTGRA